MALSSGARLDVFSVLCFALVVRATFVSFNAAPIRGPPITVVVLAVHVSPDGLSFLLPAGVCFCGTLFVLIGRADGWAVCGRSADACLALREGSGAHPAGMRLTGGWQGGCVAVQWSDLAGGGWERDREVAAGPARQASAVGAQLVTWCARSVGRWLQSSVTLGGCFGAGGSCGQRVWSPRGLIGL